jgi:hypothetical protein
MVNFLYLIIKKYKIGDILDPALYQNQPCIEEPYNEIDLYYNIENINSL